MISFKQFLMLESNQFHVSDWAGFKSTSSARGLKIVQDNQGHYNALNQQGQVVGHWDSVAGGGIVATNAAQYQQIANGGDFGQQIRDQRSKEALEMPEKIAAAQAEVNSSSAFHPPV